MVLAFKDKPNERRQISEIEVAIVYDKGGIAALEVMAATIDVYLAGNCPPDEVPGMLVAKMSLVEAARSIRLKKLAKENELLARKGK